MFDPVVHYPLNENLYFIAFIDKLCLHFSMFLTEKCLLLNGNKFKLVSFEIKVSLKDQSLEHCYISPPPSSGAAATAKDTCTPPGL